MECGRRAVGEIGEALPVADEASRFRGSAPIGGHDSDRKSVGTTVGNRRPLRKRYKGCGEVWNPPVTASLCQPPLGKGAEGTGDADCHSQFANWPRNDKVFCKRCDGRAVEDAGPYGGFTDRTSQGLPTPFRHISCSLCVDSLWINFPSPFLPPSCGNSSFPLWTKNPCISRPCGGFPQKFSLRLLLLKNT